MKGCFLSLTMTGMFFLLSVTALFPVYSHAGLRGLPEGKSRVEVGDMAPLGPNPRKANEDGSHLSNVWQPDHCIY